MLAVMAAPDVGRPPLRPPGKQADARRNVESTRVAVAVDVIAFDVLEHEDRLAGGGDAGDDEVSEVGGCESRENGALAREPLFPGTPTQCRVEQLDGDAAGEAAIAALGQPHRPHSATADWRQKRIRTKLRACRHQVLAHVWFGEQPGGRSLQESAGTVAGGKQDFHLLPQRLVGAARLRKVCLPVGAVARERPLEHTLHSRPVIERFHWGFSRRF